MANQAKMIRGQLRIIVREELANILTQEMIDAMRKDLSAQLNSSMGALDKDVRLSMSNLNKRYEEVNSYIVRSLATATKAEAPADVQPLAPTEETPPTEKS
jgi:hypothetical protein